MKHPVCKLVPNNYQINWHFNAILLMNRWTVFFSDWEIAQELQCYILSAFTIIMQLLNILDMYNCKLLLFFSDWKTDWVIMALLGYILIAFSLWYNTIYCHYDNHDVNILCVWKNSINLNLNLIFYIMFLICCYFRLVEGVPGFVWFWYCDVTGSIPRGLY